MPKEALTLLKSILEQELYNFLFLRELELIVLGINIRQIIDDIVHDLPP